MNNILIFWSYQFSQIKHEGWVAVKRKLRKLTNAILVIPIIIMAIPIVLIIRSIQPMIWVRFGYFWVNRIGHFVFDVEYYLSEKKLGLHQNNTYDIFFYDGKPANNFFDKLVRRHLKIVSWSKPLYLTNRLIPGGSRYTVLPANRFCESRDTKTLLFNKTETQLSFSTEENLLGQEFLKNIGITRNEKYIYLIVRDSKYLSVHEPNTNYEDHNYRDSDIDTYKKAILALAEKGYWIFRMGKIVEKPLHINHERVIDYANSPYRSDFLDIWLGAHCFFSISTGLGLDAVPVIYRKPIVFVNAMPLGHINTTYNPNTIWLPKRVVWSDTKQQLTLKEQIQTGIIGFVLTHEYKDTGVELIDNSPDDIMRSVFELEEKLSGKWESQSQDEELYNKFWEILQTWTLFPKFHGKMQSKMPVWFLRKNHEWFLA